MVKTDYKIIDNVIYTPEAEGVGDTNGVGHYFYNQMKTYRHEIAQIDGKTHEKDSFDSLLQRCIRTSLAMVDLELKPGDRISLITHNHLNTAVPYIASFFVGTIMGAIDPSLSVKETTHLLKQTQPKLIFVSETAVSLAEDVVERIESDTKIVVFGETTRHIPFSLFLRPHKNENSFVPRQVDNLNEVALIVFSSGSSGFPKCICYSHRNMLCFSKKRNEVIHSVIYSISNAYWNIFATILMRSVEFGFTRAIYPSFNAENPWDFFQLPVDLAFMIPFQTLFTIRSEQPKDLERKNLKRLIILGNCISKEQLEEIRAALPHTAIMQGYGQSEAFLSILQFKPEEIPLDKDVITSVGTIKPGICYKIVDIHSGKALGPNQVGELRIKSSSQFIGYYNQDSSDCFDSDGWLKTGDLLYYDEKLYFYVVGRIGENFKFRTHYISPTEIENLILNMQHIEAVVVVGIPHEIDSNHPMAIVKLKPDARRISSDEIIKFVEDRVEDKKRLRGGVKFVESIPMTCTGKVGRYKLKEMVLNNEL